MPDFSYERHYGGGFADAVIVGLDEAGCGPWAGPVVAGAAFIDDKIFPDDLLILINDSKKLTAARRQIIASRAHLLQGRGCFTATASANVSEIDSLNIRQAGILAMERAFALLCDALPRPPQGALVDGTVRPQLGCPVFPLKKGDSLSYSIALASIMAKVWRDNYMADLARIYPVYGWDKNAGYGTLHHRLALAEHGITPHHRQSFKPIAAFKNLTMAGF